MYLQNDYDKKDTRCIYIDCGFPFPCNFRVRCIENWSRIFIPRFGSGNIERRRLAQNLKGHSLQLHHRSRKKNEETETRAAKSR